MARSRIASAVVVAGLIVLGLASRSGSDVLPPAVARYAGDVLWAAMMFWIIAFVRRHATTMRVAAIALGISVAVELSQLLHLPWLDAARATRFGALVLGHGFLWSDLACYAFGVALAAVSDAVYVSSRSTRNPRAR